VVAPTAKAPGGCYCRTDGGRLVVATQSGHNIQDEQPELVLDAIRDVVRRAGR
jgi:pimeloyl-ACP methyl ester carboxylesterase